MLRCAALFILLASPLFAGEGTVRGYGRYAKIFGRSSAGYIQLYEWNLFLSPFGGTVIGPSRRLGAPPGEPPRHDGYYSVTTKEGLYSLYISQPLFYARPIVIPEVNIRAGRTVTKNASPAMDYCCNFTDTWALPWGDTWYQTFKARGTSITGVSFRLAGTSADSIEVSIRGPAGGGSPSTWPRVGTARTTHVGPLGDNWVRWRSGMVPTVPGETYAVRLRGVAGGDRKFSPFNRTKDAQSYPDGRAYNGSGTPQNYDLNVTVFSDSDGVIVTYCKTTPELGELRDGYFGSRWGQTFKARGSSLAAVDVWAAGADRHWDLDFTFTVRENGPRGKIVGPVKTTKAAYQAFGVGLHAVSYNPGEVSLVPGRTYYVEFTNPEGFNPYVMNRSQDAYPDGAAYQNGVLKDGGSVDLSMTILEYAPAGGSVKGEVRNESGKTVPGAHVRVEPGPWGTVADGNGRFTISGVEPGTYTVSAEASGYESAASENVRVTEGETTELFLVLREESCTMPFRNGGFEEGLTGWTLYGGAKPNIIEGSWFADIEAVEGDRFQGNEVNGSALPPGGLYQRFCVKTGHLYRASVWSNCYWIGGNSQAAMARIGLDPQAGTSPASGSVVWSSWHTQAREAKAAWAKISVEAEAAGPRMTLFLDFRQTDSPGGQWHINCFDGAEIEDLSPTEPEFRRGDCNGDATLDLADAVCILSYLFSGAEAGCLDALDSQDDGALDIADAVSLLQYLFAGGAPPSRPGLSCGPDPTEDKLDCAHYDC